MLSHVPGVERGALPCLTALAYYRLKRAIEVRCPDLDVRPSLPLSAFLPPRRAKRWWRYLKRETGLEFPDLIPGWAALAVGAALFLSPLGMLTFGGPAVLSCFLISPIPAVALIEVLAGRLPPDCRTVGDLARDVALRNIATLSAPVGAVRKRDVWGALEKIIREQLAWRGPVEPHTRVGSA